VGVATVLLAGLTAAACSSSPSKPKASGKVSLPTGFQRVSNDAPWRTTTGAQIRANNGSVLQVGSTYYWYGMEYDGALTDKKFNGVMRLNAYTSTDLAHWSFATTLIQSDRTNTPGKPQVGWYSNPDVLFNKATRTYVLNLSENHGQRNGVDFYTARSPLGPYTWHADKEVERPDGLHTMGNKHVFLDDDGQAYLLFVSDDGAPTHLNTNTKIALLTPDYLGIARVVSDCAGRGHEALSMLKHGRYYYMFSSQTRGWKSSPTSYKRATALNAFSCTGGDDGHGWYRVPTTPSSTDSFNTQHRTEITVRGTDITTVVYTGDRWSQFDPTVGGVGRNDWYPLTFDTSGTPVLHGLHSWLINAKTGQWRAG